MKKLLLVFFLMIIGISFNAKAYSFYAINEGDTIYYNIISESPAVVQVTFKDGFDYSGDVIIPSTVNFQGTDFSVTSIGGSTFFECYGLNSVLFPNSITTIGHDAFNYCFNLTSVNIPDGVTRIESNAFYGCGMLTSISIPSSVNYIGDGAFKSCLGLTSISVPNLVIEINEEVFKGCSGLISATIGENTTIIKNKAFEGCTNLSSFIIPNSVNEIDSWAFNGCSSLNSLVIGYSVSSMGDGAFSACTNLSSITSHAITPPIIFATTLSDVLHSIPLYIPYGSLSAYQTAQYWSAFTNIQETVGLENTKIYNLQTKLYPNPTNGNVKLAIEGIKNDSQIMVYDIFGRIIKTYNIKPYQKEINMDLKELSSGTYSVICKDKTSGFSTTNKLIIQ
ncbi:MAG: cell surface protein [Bacteroidetes bacterium]|nr:cell surface protein [Bacteroidota bacterium]